MHEGDSLMQLGNVSLQFNDAVGTGQIRGKAEPLCASKNGGSFAELQKQNDGANSVKDSTYLYGHVILILWVPYSDTGCCVAADDA